MRIPIAKCVLIASVVAIAFLFTLPSSQMALPSQVNATSSSPVAVKDSVFENYVLERDFAYERPVFEDNPYVDAADVYIPGIQNLNRPGAPALPCERVSIALEPWMMVKEVTVTPSPAEAISVPGDIAPFPTMVAVSSWYYGLYGEPEPVAALFEEGPEYAQDAYFPPSDFEQSLSFGLTQANEPGRDYIKMSTSERSQYIDLTLYPLRYNPVSGECLFSENLHVSIEYARNPSYASPMGTRAETYDMVIITPASLASKFQVLSDYRNTTSIKTRVVTLENVYAGTYFTATGTDNPEKLKNFIKSAVESWGIDYVILGGDSGQIPVRYVYIPDGADGTNTPCDLYYSDIYKSGGSFADWQVDGGSWGEFADDLADVDLRPDVTLGRLPAASTSEAQTMVNKIKNYEVAAYGAPWFKNITLMGLDTFTGDGTAEGEYYSNYLCTNYYTTARGWTQHKLYESTGTCTSGQFAQSQNQQVGILTFSDHGYETGWGGVVSNSNIWAMNNGNKLPIVSADACLCGAWDYSGSDCFAEVFLKNSNGGGVAVFAASRIGWGVTGTYHIQAVSGFINRMFHRSYTEDGATKVGGMHTGAENLYVQYQSPKSGVTDYKTICEYTLFGDPATVIGGFSRTTAKLSTDDGSKNADPGSTVQYNVSVENTGSGYAFVSFQASRSDLTPVPADWTVTFSETLLTLAPSDNRTVFMNVTCPAGADAAVVMDIVFKAISPNIEGSPLSLTTYTTVKATYGMNFTCSDNAHQIEAQTSTIYYLNLKNTGNGPLTFRLTALDKPDDWQASFSNDTVVLARDATKAVSLWVQPGPKVLSGTYELHLRCNILENPAIVKELGVSTSVLKSNGFAMSITSDMEVEVDGGVAAEFTVHLENTGNHEDSVGLAYPNKGAMPGWLFSFDPAPNVDVPAFGTTEVTAKITPPDGELAETYDVEVKATLDSDTSTKTSNVRVTVKAIYAFEVASDETEVEAESSQVKFAYDLKNLGNIQDTYDLTVTGKPTDWVVTMEGALGLDPSAQEELSLTVTTPGPSVIAGDYNLTLNVKSRASGEVKTIVYTVTVPKYYGLELQCVQTSKEVRPGEMAQFQFTVKSNSNCEEKFYISKSGQATWDAQVTKAQVTLDPFGSDSLLLEATPPLGQGIGSYKFTVQALSTSDSLAEDSVDVFVNVKQVYGLSLEVITESDSIKDKGNATFKFRLTNMGNGPDTFDITLDGIRSGWEADTTRQMELQSQQSVVGTLEVTIPEGEAEKGTYDITLFASSKGAKSDGDGALKESVNFTLEVKVTPAVLPDIIGFGGSGSDDNSWMYIFIMVIVLLIVVAIAVILIVAVRRGKRKKAKPSPPQAAPAQPSVHSSRPEYSSTQSTVSRGSQVRTPVYSVSKPPPARSKPAPARTVPKPAVRAKPPPPPPPPQKVEFEDDGEDVDLDGVFESEDKEATMGEASSEEEDAGLEWEDEDAGASEEQPAQEESKWDDAFELDDE